MSYSVAVDQKIGDRFNALKERLPPAILAEFLMLHVARLTPDMLRPAGPPLASSYVYSCSFREGRTEVRVSLGCEVSHERQEIRITDVGHMKITRG